MRKLVPVWLAICLVVGISCRPELSEDTKKNEADQGKIALLHLDSQRDSNALIHQFNEKIQKRNPKLIQMKYDAMAEGPFNFYRATAFLFYFDLREHPLFKEAPKVRLQGDFHLENMGTYRTQKGLFAFDLNDFDEACEGPYSLELVRLGVSVHLAAEAFGVPLQERSDWIAFLFSRYLFHTEQLQEKPEPLKEALTEAHVRGATAKQVRQAQAFKRPDFLKEYVEKSHFDYYAKLQSVNEKTRSEVTHAMDDYIQKQPHSPSFFKIKDIASRVAGKASLGRYRYWVLIEGETSLADDDRILELKEAIVPSLYAFTKIVTSNNHQRIVQAYRYFLPEVDPFLGVTKVHGRPAFVREYLPKETVNIENLTPQENQEFLNMVALIAARAHSRSGKGEQILKEVKKRGNWTKELLSLTERYTHQVYADYQSFMKE